MVKYTYHKFKELSAHQVYNILKLRSEVFVIEQNCIYQDLDDKDLKAVHVLVKEKEQLIGYSRILQKGLSYQKYSSIGRVVVSKEKRKKSIGIKLMEFSIKTCKGLHPNEGIKISAQTYLKNFYNKQGFIQKGESYMEDGIPHCAMYLG
tara:strand:- start:146 stop:592 length:447 start_codon:yes stop_codon:yes gene_type:complete